ncbi:MAG: hypothetical protein L0H29_04730 [Sinobacteraceae bacterium]|nr:hypothetical protein [Nevskiaceae bacterium]
MRAIGSRRLKGAATSEQLAASLEIASAILTHPELDGRTRRALTEALRIPRAKGQVRRIRLGLAEDSPLVAFLLPYCAVSVHHHTEPSGRKLTHAHVVLPSELAEALGDYAVSSRKRMARKRERGHHFTEYTVRRGIREAENFCVFLAGDGIEHWAEVSQSTYDRYIAVTTPHTGARVSPFLGFVRRRYRLTGRMQRPRIKRAPALQHVTPVADMPDIVQRMSRLPDEELRLIGLLLAIYAQPIAHSAALTTGRFRMRDQRLEALFADDWLPLDQLTSGCLRRRWPDLAKPVSTDERPLFKLAVATYRNRFRETTKLDAKAVRLGAVASILRSGVANRASIRGLLGVSMPTVEYVERIFEWDFQQTVDPDVVAARNRILRGEA